MKTLSTIFLALSIFTVSALADDGHTSGGGKTDPPPCTENCPGSLVSGSSTIIVAISDPAADVSNSYFDYAASLFFELFV